MLMSFFVLNNCLSVSSVPTFPFSFFSVEFSLLMITKRAANKPVFGGLSTLQCVTVFGLLTLLLCWRIGPCLSLVVWAVTSTLGMREDHGQCSPLKVEKATYMSDIALWHWKSVGAKCLLMIAHYQISISSYFIFLFLENCGPTLSTGEWEFAAVLSVWPYSLAGKCWVLEHL